MVRIWGLFLVVVLLSGPSVSVAAECSIASTAIKVASRLRGLSVKKPVPCKLKDKSQVEQYLRDTIDTKIPADRLKYEEVAFKLLGFLPRDYDYTNGLIELYTQQIGGYYDPELDYYAMASWMPQAMQMPIAVHELTHALQDQHYDLDKFTDHHGQSSDELLARSALVEGDATAVMMDYSRELMGQGSIRKMESVSGFMLQSIAGSMFSSSLHSAPPTLQTMLIFPYVSGINFVHDLLKKGGYRSVDEAYKRLPGSTEEILHPEKYHREGKRDFVVISPRLPRGEVSLKSETPVYSDVLGEFMISVLLVRWISPAKASASARGWGGDRLAIYEHAHRSREVLVWVTAWDSKSDADEFYGAMREVFSAQLDGKPVVSASTVSFVDDEVGRVEIVRNEREVVVNIGH